MELHEEVCLVHRVLLQRRVCEVIPERHNEGVRDYLRNDLQEDVLLGLPSDVTTNVCVFPDIGLPAPNGGTNALQR